MKQRKRISETAVAAVNGKLVVVPSNATAAQMTARPRYRLRMKEAMVVVVVEEVLLLLRKVVGIAGGSRRLSR